ncbi:MAG TPA: hydantoinase/oxoprolinase family protein, partial [Candidatus Obscuribacterales bacterium]
PLMVMRSDGGIMSIDEMRRRPILTMLSGPAAGVAAALMYAQVSDGIFIEVGGTSSDITVIRNGRPQVKSAQIGGHRLYVQTLDVRTLGIAGGSIPRFGQKQLKDVGPRSAHIAELAYPAFDADPDFSAATVEFFAPKPGDPADYLKLNRGGKGYTVTPTEAAWFLDLVKVEGHGEANREALTSALKRTASEMGSTPAALATAILEKASDKIKPTIKQLLREYKLDPDLIQFVGGGGGAMAIVPFAAHHQGFEHRIVAHTEVISAIGAALGLIRDSVERTLISPSNEDLIQIRQEAYDSVLAMGAAADTIEVSVEVDTRNKKVIAIATGASELRSGEAQVLELSPADLQQIAARALKTEPDQVSLLGRTEQLLAFGQRSERRLLGVFKQVHLKVRVLERQGTIRLQLNDCQIETAPVQELRRVLPRLIEQLTAFGDAGGLLPELYLLLGGRIVDLGGVADLGQMLALLEQETRLLPGTAPAVVLAQRKS